MQLFTKLVQVMTPCEKVAAPGNTSSMHGALARGPVVVVQKQ